MTAAGPGPGAFVGLLGLRPVSMGDGQAVFALTVGPAHLNPYGVVHGGAIYALADTAMGGAVVSTLDPGQRCATLEVKINYLAAVGAGELRCRARVVGRTRRIALLEARVEAGDRLIALATGSFYITYNSDP